MTKPEALEKIAELYVLIGRMNAIAFELKNMGVELSLGGGSLRDPLETYAVLRITLGTEFSRGQG